MGGGTTATTAFTPTVGDTATVVATAAATTIPTAGGGITAATLTRAAATPSTAVGGTATTAGTPDIDMTSHHDLQGASCVVGGVLRGRAQGNVYNMADPMDTEDPFTTSVMGNFFVFGSWLHDLTHLFQVKFIFSGCMVIQIPWSHIQ